MGTIGSYLRTYSNNDPDPLTGLTSKEKYLLQSSFNSLKKDLSGVAINLFLIFLKEHPEEQNRFPFKDVPYDDLRNNKTFTSHAVTVIYSVGSLVDNINREDILIGLIDKIAQKHYKRNIGEESFMHLRDAILELLTPTVNSETAKVWRKTLDAVFGAVLKQMAVLQCK